MLMILDLHEDVKLREALLVYDYLLRVFSNVIAATFYGILQIFSKIALFRSRSEDCSTTDISLETVIVVIKVVILVLHNLIDV